MIGVKLGLKIKKKGHSLAWNTYFFYICKTIDYNETQLL